MKANKLIIQERSKDYTEEAEEGATALSQGYEEFDGADEKFEEAHPDENTFDAARRRERREGTLAEGGEHGRV